MTQPILSKEDELVLMPREATRAMTMAGCDMLPSCEHVFGHAGEMLKNAYRKMVEVAALAATPALEHLGNAVYFCADIHPDDRNEALDNALAYYNEQMPRCIVGPSGHGYQRLVNPPLPGLAATPAVGGERIPLADHDEIGRKVLGRPWAVQSAIVTIAAHCTVLTDKYPTGDVADLAGCISECCLELANALAAAPPASPSAVGGEREALINAIDSPTVAALARVFDPHHQHFYKSYSEQIVEILVPRLAAPPASPLRNDK